MEFSDVVSTLPPQSLLALLPLDLERSSHYRTELGKLPQPSGAIVFYGAINRSYLPDNCPSHIQLSTEDLGSLFISISREGDGRAPTGQVTLTASVFTETADWCDLDIEK